jgi:hypothetical protein
MSKCAYSFYPVASPSNSIFQLAEIEENEKKVILVITACQVKCI